MRTRKKVFIIIGSIVLGLGLAAGYFYMGILAQMNNEDPMYWEDDIVEIEARYDVTPDVDIVFIGSSSIRKWDSLADDFSEYSVVNHGFGGSKVADSTFYYDRLVTPFTPELVVIFSGTNDVHGMTDNSKTGQQVFDNFKDFYEKSQLETPGVPVVYISITPTPSRWDVWSDAQEANDLIEAYAETQDNLYFVDAVDEFMKNGVPNKDLFQGDNLHLTEEGYQIWAELIKTTVDSILN